MAKFKVLQASFINNSLVQVGDVIDFDGDAGENLAPYNKSKDAKEAQALEDSLLANAMLLRNEANADLALADADPSNPVLAATAAESADKAVAAEAEVTA